MEIGVSPHNVGSWRRWLAAIGVTGACTGLTVAAFLLVSSWSNQNVRKTLDRAVADRAAEIETDVKIVDPVLTGMRGCYVAYGIGDRKQFESLAAPLIAYFPGVRSLQWVPRVSAADRAGHERTARNDGVAGYRIREKNAAGKMVPAGPRDEYYPVFYGCPGQEAGRRLGFDHASVPARWQAMCRARDTGKLAISDSVPVINENEAAVSNVAFLPIYSPGMAVDTVEQRRRHLMGFFVASIHVQELVERALLRVAPIGVDTWVFEETDSGDRRLISSHYSRTRPDRRQLMASLPPERIPQGEHQRSFSLGGRRWTVLCTPAPRFFDQYRCWERWAVLATSLLLTVLIGVFFFSDRKRVEWELKRYAGQLESNNKKLNELYTVASEATRAKSAFLANMSHEIRTPMTAILGFIDVLSGSLERPGDVEIVETIRRNGEYLLQLINDILDLSKIDAKKLVVERQACSPAGVVADGLSLMRGRADAKHLPLEVEYRGAIPDSIQSDSTRLRQILINLVGNAVKFTESGSVLVAVEFLAGRGSRPQMRFDVIDTGIGMTRQHVAQLFEPFAQGDSSTTRRFGGTGLGLAISKRLAKILGGDLVVASSPGKGSIFTLTVDAVLPPGARRIACVGVAAAKSESPAAAPPRARLNCRVLLAEDGLDNQRLIVFLLEKAGAEVTVAENGQAAVDRIHAIRQEGLPLDLIFMDIQMPILDGYEATRKLRAEGCTTPIVALTAHAMAGDRQKCLDAGCDDYLTKPVTAATLIDMVAKHLPQPAAPTPLASCSTTQGNS